jgi:hypothetical protein
MRTGRRHFQLGVVAGNPFDDWATFSVAGGDRPGERALGEVEPQVGLASGGVGAMASETAVGEDRSDVPVVGGDVATSFARPRDSGRRDNRAADAENNKAGYEIAHLCCRPRIDMHAFEGPRIQYQGSCTNGQADARDGKIMTQIIVARDGCHESGQTREEADRRAAVNYNWGV